MEKVPSEFLEDAINDLSEITNELRRITLAGGPSLPPLFLQKLFRALHTIKGSAQTFGLDNEARLAHDAETFLAALQKGHVAWNTKSENMLAGVLSALAKNFTLISANKDPISAAGLSEELLALAGDTDSFAKALSLPDNFPAQFASKLSTAEIQVLYSRWEAGKEILILEFGAGKKEFAAKFKLIRKELENKAEVIAVAPGQATENTTLFRFLNAADKSEELAGTVSRFNAKVLFQKQKEAAGKEPPLNESAGNELAETILHGEKAAALLGKRVKLTAARNPVKIPQKLSKIASTILLHLVRNAVDHGIEFPLERTALKKPARGNIEITIGLTKKDLLISVCDDGRGIENAPEIFTAGYSTAPFVAGLSGRGVGLDIVRDAVQKAHGIVKVNSKPGHGTKFEIDLPL